jgi:predicted RNA-binding protein YlxR (DUF448 family)/ribosomal protein L30E
MIPHPESDPGLTPDIVDDGPVRGGNAPAPDRQCAVTRERLARSAMIRFVLSPEGEVTPDLQAHLPGRGVWIRSDRQVLEAGARKGVFARAFKTPVRVPDGLTGLVELLLARRCIDLLGLARKAGLAIAGFDQVRDAIREARPAVLLEASDGAEDGRRKVYFLAEALYAGVPVAGALSAAELGMAFGRDHVVHGLLRRGALADNWSSAYRRLTGFRQAPELEWFPGQGA